MNKVHMLPPTLIFASVLSSLLFLPDILQNASFYLAFCMIISAVLFYQFIERSKTKLPVLYQWTSSLPNTITLCLNTLRRFSSNIYMYFPIMSFWVATMYWFIEGQTLPTIEILSLLAGAKIITTVLWYEAIFNSIYSNFPYVNKSTTNNN